MNLGIKILAVFLVLGGIVGGLLFFFGVDSKKSVEAEVTSLVLQPSAEVKGVQVASVSPSPVVTATPKPQVRRSIYLGFWTQGFFDVGSSSLHPEALKTLEAKVGKKAAVAHYYRGWEELSKPQFLSEMETISSNGWRPMVSANPYFFDKCPANGMPIYKAIASGNCDEFIKEVGRNFKSYGSPFFLRFAWEMNIASMEWQVARSGSSNEDFVAAWRHFHDLVYAEGGSNALFVFAPDVGETAYASIYPGDGYVDWVGLDGYNWGTTQGWSSWKSFSQVYFNAYNSITSVAPSKPVMLSEVNTTDQGGDKAKWYQKMLSDELIDDFPKVKMVVFYNEDRSSKEGVNWLIDATPSYLKAFSEAVSSPNYLSSF